MNVVVARHASPVGELVTAERAGVLVALAFEEHWTSIASSLQSRFAADVLTPGPSPDVTRALEAYFSGDVRAIDALECDPGGTPFQSSVWHALRKIEAGATASYGDVARWIGAPKAVRAVGITNGRNPIAIVLPCHRVIGANGKLTGYGGGLSRKEWLLAHEAKHAGKLNLELFPSSARALS